MSASLPLSGSPDCRSTGSSVPALPVLVAEARRARGDMSTAQQSTGLAQDVTKALDRHAPASASTTHSPEADAAAKEIANLRAEIMDLVETLEDALKER